MWSLKVTILVQQAGRGSLCRIAGDVDQKCQKTENDVYLTVYMISNHSLSIL